MHDHLNNEHDSHCMREELQDPYAAVERENWNAIKERIEEKWELQADEF